MAPETHESMSSADGCAPTASMADTSPMPKKREYSQNSSPLAFPARSASGPDPSPFSAASTSDADLPDSHARMEAAPDSRVDSCMPADSASADVIWGLSSFSG